MSVPFLVFFASAFLAVLGAVLLILSWEPVHSALSLVLVMMSLAVLYLLLGADFIAAAQILVYAGAIMVLFVFVIMLLNAGTEERTNWSKIAILIGLPMGFFLMLLTALWLFRSPGASTIANGIGAPSNAGVSARVISIAILRQYLFPFEATSILVLIAVMGAWILGRKDD